VRIFPRGECIVSIEREVYWFEFEELVDDENNKIQLGRVLEDVGLPCVASLWSNSAVLRYWRIQQSKIAAFASGLHERLGQGSLIRVLGDTLCGWSSLRSQQNRAARTCESANGAPTCDVNTVLGVS